jgi:hypothetical protein
MAIDWRLTMVSAPIAVGMSVVLLVSPADDSIVTPGEGHMFPETGMVAIALEGIEIAAVDGRGMAQWLK